MTAQLQANLRSLPSVNKVSESPQYLELAAEFGDGLAKLALRAVIDEARERILGGATDPPTVESLLETLYPRLMRLARPAGRRAINASGVLLHTGLGRAPLCRDAIEALSGFEHFSVLQVDVESGGRGKRDREIEQLLIHLTGCEAATVLNNNAAATMAVLNALAAGKEVVISRGQLVEIGGSFRLPDVMQKSGAILRDVGTTNRTHLRDYEEAINERTGALLHVHTSNYRIRGFTSTPSIEELVALGRQHQLPVIDDVGSGALVSLEEYALPAEPLVRDSVRAGSDIVCFSGDKLICGPQSGILVGKRATLERIRKSAFARAFRVCKLTLAALQATLVHFVNGTYKTAVPLYRMLGRSLADLEAQAQELITRLGSTFPARASIEEDESYLGSGSIPDEGIPTRVVSLTHERLPAEVITRRLRLGLPAVFTRMRNQAVLLDMRMVEPEELAALAFLLGNAFTEKE